MVHTLTVLAIETHGNLDKNKMLLLPELFCCTRRGYELTSLLAMFTSIPVLPISPAAYFNPPLCPPHPYT